jgi:hypothetical protein
MRSLILLVSVLVASASHAEMQISQDGRGQVVSISGLYDDPEGCHIFRTDGLIVKREFKDDALTLSGVVLEASDGARSIVNVDIEPGKLGMAAKGNLMHGLQLLTAVGRKASVAAYACGAAGRVFFLDAIK